MIKKEIKPIKERPEDYDAIEASIDAMFRQYLYGPLLKDLLPAMKVELVKNAKDENPVVQAINGGKIYFYRGEFKGKFSAAVTRELKRMGAEWSKKDATFKIAKSKLPKPVIHAIESSDARFSQVADRIDRQLKQFLPEEIADNLRVEKHFDSTLWKINRELEETVKGITVVPKLTDYQREKIAKEYTQNMKLYIQEWTEKEIVKLRAKVEQSVLSGTRYEGLVKTIQESYGSSLSKAKFLARQETSLMMTKFKQTRYVEAGSEEYIWQCVVGSKDHPVRPMHKALEGKTYRWDAPPITDIKGNRNNPGQDYNCRCFARPIIKF